MTGVKSNTCLRASLLLWQKQWLLVSPSASEGLGSSSGDMQAFTRLPVPRSRSSIERACLSKVLVRLGILTEIMGENRGRERHREGLQEREGGGDTATAEQTESSKSERKEDMRKGTVS